MPTALDRRLAALGATLALLLLPAAGGASATLPARGTVEIAFSPADDPEAVLRKVISAARQTLHVQAYAFTSRNIAQALIAAQRRGVEVSVLADAQMNRRGKGNVLPTLIEAGIPVALETDYAAAHNKVLIADAEGPACAVVTGSYNFTWSAKHRNAENLIVLRGDCALARIFLENWQRHHARATPVTELPWNP